MKRFIFGFLVLAVAGAAHADDAKVEGILRARLELIEEAKAESEATIEAMEKGSIRPRQKEASAMGRTARGLKFAFRTKEDRDRAIETFKKNTSDEALAAEAAPPLLISNIMDIGDFGYIPSHAVLFDGALNFWRCKVQQVIDERNMLVKVTRHDATYTTAREAGSYLIWVVGKYSGVIDGQNVTLKSVFRVTGTKQYTTAIGGSKTVFMLEPFDIAPIVERLKAEAAANKPAEPKPDAVPEFREWSDATGQFKLTARLISVADGKVKLEKQDGSVANVPVDKLSEADQKVVAHLEAPAT